MAHLTPIARTPARRREAFRDALFALLWAGSASAVALGCGGSTDPEPGGTNATGGVGAGGAGAGGGVDANATGGSGGGVPSGGDSASVESGGTARADQGNPPVCAVCANAWFTCSKPGFESVNFQVESQNPKGCAGHLVQFSGATDAYTIDCELSQVCGPVGCFAATITANSFSWDGATCASGK